MLRIHHPPLHMQRKRAVDMLLAEHDCRFVVDAGCGQGEHVRFLLSRDFCAYPVERILAIDYDENELHAGMENAVPSSLFALQQFYECRVTWVQGDLTAPDVELLSQYLCPCGGKSAASHLDSCCQACPDAVISIEVVEHIPHHRVPQYANTLFHVLGASARHVLITTPNSDLNRSAFMDIFPGHRRHPDHKFEWSAREFRHFCEAVLCGNFSGGGGVGQWEYCDAFVLGEGCTQGAWFTSVVGKREAYRNRTVEPFLGSVLQCERVTACCARTNNSPLAAPATHSAWTVLCEQQPPSASFQCAMGSAVAYTLRSCAERHATLSELAFAWPVHKLLKYTPVAVLQRDFLLSPCASLDHCEPNTAVCCALTEVECLRLICLCAGRTGLTVIPSANNAASSNNIAAYTERAVANADVRFWEVKLPDAIAGDEESSDDMSAFDLM